CAAVRTGADRDRAAAGIPRIADRLGGILDEIDDHAAHELGIEADAPARACEIADQNDVVRQALLAQNILEPGVGIDLGAVEIAHPGEVEEIGDDAVAALDVAIDAIERPIELDALAREAFQ